MMKPLTYRRHGEKENNMNYTYNMKSYLGSWYIVRTSDGFRFEHLVSFRNGTAQWSRFFDNAYMTDFDTARQILAELKGE